MDLCEISEEIKVRHPWELARIKTLRHILLRANVLYTELRTLDIGCGDGFAVTELFKLAKDNKIDAVDINLSKNGSPKIVSQSTNVNFHNNYDSLKESSYDLILFLDILEHIKRDTVFLKNVIGSYLAQDGQVLITVPAFNFLYGNHDRFLGHCRRYSLQELELLIAKAGLKSVRSGYLFPLLLPLRFMSTFFEKVISFKDDKPKGIGCWNGGFLLTKIMEIVLFTDNLIALFLNRLGLKIPGLSVWALCIKQPS